MKNVLFFALLLFCTTVQATTFQTTSLEEAKVRALSESRPVFVDFTATWCAPCRHLEEYTFSDPAIQHLLTEDFVSVQLDVETIDGYAYAQQYGVSSLPTMLIFDRDGSLLRRLNKAVGAATLAQELENILANHPAPTPQPDLYDPAAEVPLATSHENAQDQFGQPTRYAQSQPTQINAWPMTAAAARVPVETVPPSVVAPPATVVPEPVASTTNTVAATITKPEQRTPSQLPNLSGTGLFRVDVDRQEAVGYSIQIGVYADYENVLRETANVRTVYEEQPLVHISELNGQRVFKLLLGDFSTYAAAANFANIVRNDGNRDAFVKDLTDFAVAEEL